MRIPKTNYVGLYGSHSGDWRSVCVRALRNQRIPWYDPTDRRWASISGKNGDSHQALINRLVEKQHRGMLDASCVIFHLARRKFYRREENKPSPDDTGKIVSAFAARCELGFLIGRGIQTFVHIEPNVEGRNYLWAAMRNYPHMVQSQTLEGAIDLAIDFILGSGALKK